MGGECWNRRLFSPVMYLIFLEFAQFFGVSNYKQSCINAIDATGYIIYIIIFFFLPRLGCHQRVTASPLQGVVTGQKDTNEKSIHTHTHSSQPLRHSSVLQERCNHTSYQPFGHHGVWSHPGPPTRLHCRIITSSGVPPEVPIPLRTASKVCPCPDFINHTILSVNLLHASRSKHTSLAASKPISLSAHALLTPSLHLKGGLPLPLSPSTSDASPLLVILSLPIRSTCPNHFNTFRSTLPLNFSGTPTLSLTTSFLTLSILVTPHILLRHFISATSSLSLPSISPQQFF